VLSLVFLKHNLPKIPCLKQVRMRLDDFKMATIMESYEKV
jgi:hypothetical protein